MNKELKELSDLISFHKQLPAFEGLGFSSHEINVGDKKRTYNAKDIEGYPSKLTEEIADKLNEVLGLFESNNLSKEDVEMFSDLYLYWDGQTLNDYIKERDLTNTLLEDRH
jgi:hypothetical protein